MTRKDDGHLYIRHHTGRFDAPYQIVSRVYVGWWGKYKTRAEAEQALAAYREGKDDG